MESKGLLVNGRAAKRVTLGDAVLFEEQHAARYAYYFNGIDARCQFTTMYFGYAPDGDRANTPAFGIRWKSVTRGESFINGSGVYFLRISGGRLSLVTTNSRTVCTVDCEATAEQEAVLVTEEGNTSVSINGAMAGSIALDGSRIVRVSTIGWWSGSAYAEGWVYGVSLDGSTWTDLEALPGVRFTNVVRYEVDAEGEPIESTATILNG